MEWDRYDLVVIRSCWDYHHKIEGFERWTRQMEAAGVRVWNPPALLRWNARKTYLRDLARRGVPIVPTRFIEPSDEPALDAVLEQAGWPEAVVKPVVSASAHETWRAARGRREDAERFTRLAASVPVMVQPFVREVEREGEWSLCFFGGRFSHAVIKRPRAGDFRVQPDHGGVVQLSSASESLVAEAGAALEAAGQPTVYARVDGYVIADVFHLMELELLEPSLFLGLTAEAPARFASAITDALAGGRSQE
ncbi:MAG TPA: hypothetical protein VFT84_14945 [Gemmatimonadales bacterium]|nr:hypothetical protein [Gemmatimonadales bacterium]